MIQKLRLYLGWACGILAAGLFLTDCFGGHTEHVQGTLSWRSYHAPYTTVSCSGKPIHCTVINHPAEYWLHVQSSEGYASVKTDPWKYYTIHEGQALTYTRVRTRWSNYTWGNSY